MHRDTKQVLLGLGVIASLLLAYQGVAFLASKIGTAPPSQEERFAAQLKATQDRKRAEFLRDRSSIMAEAQRLLAAKNYSGAKAIASQYSIVGDPDLMAIGGAADDGAAEIASKEEAAAQLAYARGAKLDAEAKRKRAKSEGVSIGMTREEALASRWGRPQSINTTTFSFGVHEQWVYGGRNYLYFENGILTAIQN